MQLAGHLDRDAQGLTICPYTLPPSWAVYLGEYNSGKAEVKDSFLKIGDATWDLTTRWWSGVEQALSSSQAAGCALGMKHGFTWMALLIQMLHALCSEDFLHYRVYFSYEIFFLGKFHYLFLFRSDTLHLFLLATQRTNSSIQLKCCRLIFNNKSSSISCECSLFT